MSRVEVLKNNLALIAFPPKAEVGRVVHKSKIYERGSVNTRVRELFVRQVEQIVWQYKLAPETINLPARPEVPEIQIFVIQLKTSELDFDVLRCIDTAVQFPIIFELVFDGKVQVVAAYKRPSEADVSRWVISNYFATGWLSIETVRNAMPLALDLASLYEQLLQRLIPLSVRPQESLANLMARTELVASKRRELEKTASKLAKEKQFNRKVQINAVLRALNAELDELGEENEL